MGKYEVHTKLMAIWRYMYIDFIELWMQTMWLKAKKKRKKKKIPQKTKSHVFNF